MPFNEDKCHVLHMGNAKHLYMYTMESVVQEKDVGVIISDNVKP